MVALSLLQTVAPMPRPLWSGAIHNYANSLSPHELGNRILHPEGIHLFLLFFIVIIILILVLVLRLYLVLRTITSAATNS